MISLIGVRNKIVEEKRKAKGGKGYDPEFGAKFDRYGVAYLRDTLRAIGGAATNFSGLVPGSLRHIIAGTQLTAPGT